MNPFLDHKNSYMISYNFANLVIMCLSKYNWDFGTNEINSLCEISSKVMYFEVMNSIFPCTTTYLLINRNYRLRPIKYDFKVKIQSKYLRSCLFQ